MYRNEWKAVLDAVDSFACGRNSTWYRGVSSPSHSPVSGLFRLRLASLDDYLSLEGQLYAYYHSLGYSLHGGDSGWPLLYTMQHYGMKTRLLDWSESFAVALFFAALNWTGDSIRVWMLDPEQLNMEAIGERKIISPFPSDAYPRHFQQNAPVHSMAVYPMRNNARLISQQGVFTVQGNSCVPLEDEFDGRLVQTGALKSVDIGIELRGDVQRHLTQHGINLFTMLPDLDGLSRHLNETFIKPAWL